MGTDNFQTLSLGNFEINPPESLFSEERSQKRPLAIPASRHTAPRAQSMSRSIDGFIINKPNCNMDNMNPSTELASSLDDQDQMSQFMFPHDLADTGLDFEDNYMFKDRNDHLQHKEEDDDDAQSASDLSRPSSPGTFSPVSHPVFPTDNTFQDTCTTIINQSEGLRLEDQTLDNTSIWDQVTHSLACEDGLSSIKARKAHRVSSSASVATTCDDQEPPSAAASLDMQASGFLSKETPPANGFVFTKFGQSVDSLRTEATNACGIDVAGVSTNDQFLSKKTSNVASKSPKGGAYRPMKKLKEPALNLTFPARAGKKELKILTQPEEQHRARYLTEGSRGAIKDRSQNGFPVIKLCGYDEPVKLQIFIGNDQGKTKPHGFYQACQVCGKNASHSMQKDIEGTTVIEMQLDPNTNMTATIDCVGILKLRNADVEQRIGLARSKKKSTRARLVFRTNIPNTDGTYQTLQTASNPILCTQPAGAPEISKKSLKECSVEGGEEMFIIGKNFSKGTRVVLRQEDEGKDSWTADASVDQDYFQQTHMIVTVPPYRDLAIKEPVTVQIQVHSSGRVSDSCPLTYMPAAVTVVKEEVCPAVQMASVPMETEACPLAKAVSPVALEYNKMFQEAVSKGELTSDMLLQSSLSNQEAVQPLASQQMHTECSVSLLQDAMKQEAQSPPSWPNQSCTHSPQAASQSSPHGQKRTIQDILNEDHDRSAEGAVLQKTTIDQVMEVLKPKVEKNEQSTAPAMLHGETSEVVTVQDISATVQQIQQEHQQQQIQQQQQVADQQSLNQLLHQLQQHAQQQQNVSEHQSAQLQQLQQQEQSQVISSPGDHYTPHTPRTPRTPHTPQNFVSPPPEVALPHRQAESLPPKLDLEDIMNELGKLQEQTASSNRPAEQAFACKSPQSEAISQSSSFIASESGNQQGFLDQSFTDNDPAQQQSPQSQQSQPQQLVQDEYSMTSEQYQQPNQAAQTILSPTEQAKSGFGEVAAEDLQNPVDHQHVLDTSPGRNQNAAQSSADMTLAQQLQANETVSDEQAMDTSVNPRQGESQQSESVLKDLLLNGLTSASINSSNLPHTQNTVERKPVVSNPTTLVQPHTSQSSSENAIFDDLVSFLSEPDSGDNQNRIHQILHDESGPPQQTVEVKEPAVAEQAPSANANYEEPRLERREQSMETLCSNEQTPVNNSVATSVFRAPLPITSQSLLGSPVIFNVLGATAQHTVHSRQEDVALGLQSVVSWSLSTNSTTTSTSQGHNILNSSPFQTNVKTINQFPLIVSQVQQQPGQQNQQLLQLQQQQQQQEQRRQQEEQLELQQQEQLKLQEIHKQNELQLQQQEQLKLQEIRKQNELQLQQQEQLKLQEIRKQNELQLQQQEQLKLQEIRKQNELQLQQQEQLKLQEIRKQNELQLQQQEQLKLQEIRKQNELQLQQQEQLKLQEIRKQNQLQQLQQQEQLKLQEIRKSNELQQQKQQELLQQQQQQQPQTQQIRVGSVPNGKAFQAVATTGPQGQTIIQLIPSSQLQVTNQNILQLSDILPNTVQVAGADNLATLLLQKADKPKHAQIPGSIATQQQPIMVNSNTQQPILKTALTQPMVLGKESVSSQPPQAQASQGSIQTLLLNVPGASLAAQPQGIQTSQTATFMQPQQQLNIGTTAQIGQPTLTPGGAMINVLPATSGTQSITIITDDRQQVLYGSNGYPDILPSSGVGQELSSPADPGPRVVVTTSCEISDAPSAFGSTVKGSWTTSSSQAGALPDLYSIMDVDGLLNSQNMTNR